MGTPAVIRVYDETRESSSLLLTFTILYDGDPQNTGKDLANFLKRRTLTRGIGEPRHTANGMGCLAAQLIKKFKTRVGGLYMVLPTDPLEDSESYSYAYDIYPDTVDSEGFAYGKVRLSCRSGPHVLFDGLAEKFNGDTAAIRLDVLKGL